MTQPSAAIYGCSGTALTPEEIAFFRDQQPWGFILFARNVETPEQVSALVAEMREATGRVDTPILIDQEGGRVQRLRPPHWQNYPTGWSLGDVYRNNSQDGLRAAWLQSRLIGEDLQGLGINVDCLPLLDVPVEGAHDVIGDRAYSHDPDVVTQMGQAAAEGLLAAGVLPVIKHIPGHGRAFSDSHLELPIVDTSHEELAETDFVPFKALAKQPLAMTAHVVYTALDKTAPATLSSHVISNIIREEIGFGGLLMTDDMSMKALSGDFSARTEMAFAAGCDLVLHCNGEMEEMQAIAAATPRLTGASLERAGMAEGKLGGRIEADIDALRREFFSLTSQFA